ncbi:pyridoxamine 5'-phosphate oxidase [Glaciimonas sp. PCH181]|uniref:pyridoxamine 5'-phosphate oxidase n=1 Tax=Glaciimonas sp. PCH181 TaxID=2133943 RepID=UPI000D3665FE|nr:pyridoxamine 5'-phosphate oxidase [Glaciimonas sp. PCH181]PUA17350.1 pyridoxamine 5'-phosphate oxidase [Glaciimonas sp. PCH181]
MSIDTGDGPLLISGLRVDYSHASLSKADTLADPMAQFGKWLQEAISAEVPEPNAMSLATVNAAGRPSSRIVLIKNFDATGITWFTNYTSRKGEELAQNPYAALLFHWVELQREVRIEGKVERISDAENDAYFATRPLRSRLGAIASAQSQPVANRAVLEANFAEAEKTFGEHPPRPKNWGGYKLVPDTVEFWQGRRSRLHDRILYQLDADGNWQRQRLQP